MNSKTGVVSLDPKKELQQISDQILEKIGASIPVSLIPILINATYLTIKELSKIPKYKRTAFIVKNSGNFNDPTKIYVYYKRVLHTTDRPVSASTPTIKISEVEEFSDIFNNILVKVYGSKLNAHFPKSTMFSVIEFCMLQIVKLVNNVREESRFNMIDAHYHINKVKFIVVSNFQLIELPPISFREII